jgi:hypothetical protein
MMMPHSNFLQNQSSMQHHSTLLSHSLVAVLRHQSRLPFAKTAVGPVSAAQLEM